MKEKNKKFKFKKWYLMPIFVVVFLCVFGLSVVKPVKAEYYTENPTFVANTQYAFDIQFESPINDGATFMFPLELYNYTEEDNTNPIYLAIDTFSPIDGSSVNYGYVEQTHYFYNYDGAPNTYDYMRYRSILHFISLFTNYDSYMTYVNEEFVFIPSGATGYSNFSFWNMPYFNSIIQIEKDLNNNQYAKLITCEFDAVYLTIGSNGVEEIVVPFSYDFTEDASNIYDNVDLYYTLNETNYDIVNVDNEWNRVGAYFYPYRLIDYMLRDSFFFYTQNMVLIRNLKIYTSVQSRTQVTGNDDIITLYTPVTKQSDISFDSVDYKNENYSIELLNANLTPSQWGQIQIAKLQPTQVNIDYDMTTWLITAVGSFMNAELFPGFAIGGILAVLVAFPIVVWFLKVVLGG